MNYQLISMMLLASLCVFALCSILIANCLIKVAKEIENHKRELTYVSIAIDEHRKILSDRLEVIALNIKDLPLRDKEVFRGHYENPTVDTLS